MCCDGAAQLAMLRHCIRGMHLNDGTRARAALVIENLVDVDVSKATFIERLTDVFASRRFTWAPYIVAAEAMKYVQGAD